jgi:hypothetical protein
MTALTACAIFGEREKCPACDADIAGVWEPGAPKRSDGTGIPRAVGLA